MDDDRCMAVLTERCELMRFHPCPHSNPIDGDYDGKHIALARERDRLRALLQTVSEELRAITHPGDDLELNDKGDPKVIDGVDNLRLRLLGRTVRAALGRKE